MGRTTTKIPRRLVSLCPSVTELVFALGRGDRLVAATRYCTHPPEGVAGLERVGGTKDPDLGRILELEPDLVLLNREENRREDAEALEAAGCRLHVGHPRNPDETADMVLDLGRLLNAGETAGRLAQEIAREIAAVRRRAEDRPGPPPRFGVLVWRKPWMGVGGGTYISSLLETAGGRNVLADADGPYPALTVEGLVARRPDVVLLPSEPFPFAPKHRDELAELTAWSPGRFRFADGRLLGWHGPSTPDGLRLAARILDGTMDDPEPRR